MDPDETARNELRHGGLISRGFVFDLQMKDWGTWVEHQVV